MLEIELTLFEEYFQKSENKKVCNKITDFGKWSQQGSNLWPADYESAALTDWAIGPKTIYL